MPINFPSSPTLNQVYTFENRSWEWNGEYWQSITVTVGFTGSQGELGFTGSLGYTGSQGPAGTGISIKGSVATPQDLVTPYLGDEGDGYIVQSDGDLYIWDGAQWVNVGQIVGPQGFVGSRGDTGYTGSAGTNGYTGSQGPAGSSVSIKGSVASPEGLVTPYLGDVGDGYISESDGDLYIWDGAQWVNVGQIVGNTGFTGSQGELGYTGSAGVDGYTGSQGLGLDEWIRITANYTAQSGNRLIADTTTASFTVTLPSTPALGEYIVLTDGGDWSINPLIVSAGGASIEGYTEDVSIDVGGVTTELLWDGSMWQITATIGAAGNPGPGVPDGGTTGQILAKLSNTDYDTAWINPTDGADLGSLSVTGSTISTTDSSAITIDRNLIVDGDLLPESDSIYDLGSPTRKWHSLYVSGNSIYINDTALTVNQDGDLLVGGALPQSNIVSLEDIPDVVISGATPGQVLGYTGSNWTATTVEGGGGGADSYVKTYFWEGALQENVSLKRFYIHVASTLETITVNLGSAGLTQSAIQIKRNDQVLNSIVIPADTTYVLETVDHSLSINDYLTVDITQSSSAANLYVTFVYRE